MIGGLKNRRTVYGILGDRSALDIDPPFRQTDPTHLRARCIKDGRLEPSKLARVLSNSFHYLQHRCLLSSVDAPAWVERAREKLIVVWCVRLEGGPDFRASPFIGTFAQDAMRPSFRDQRRRRILVVRPLLTALRQRFDGLDGVEERLDDAVVVAAGDAGIIKPLKIVQRYGLYHCSCS